MQGKKILVIDDDLQLRQVLERSLTKTGAQVVQAGDGKQGLRQFYAVKPDLVILDIAMPEMDGWETCRQIRMLSDTPVILLTAMNQDEDVIRGLDLGADDFISKPFSPQVLVARANAALRRSEMNPTGEAPAAYSDDYLVVDIQNHQVFVADEPVYLSAREYDLLTYLIKNAGRVCTYQQILENIWGWEYQDSIDYVHVYTSHLRQKLEKDPKNPSYLQTVPRLGYRFIKQPS